jgi:hypothetical protein
MTSPPHGGPAPAPAGPGTENADAAAYQRLRGHLACLKLNAAIEALPGVLDSARDGQLTVLAALEQLMAAEAAAAEARKLAVRLHFAALPAPWRLELSGVDLEMCRVSAGSDVAEMPVASAC